MPEVEIDIDDLLEVNSDDERASKLQVKPPVSMIIISEPYCSTEEKCHH